jgi:hypothetical protein
MEARYSLFFFSSFHHPEEIPEMKEFMRTEYISPNISHKGSAPMPT